MEQFNQMLGQLDKGRIVALLVRRGANSLYIPFRAPMGTDEGGRPAADRLQPSPLSSLRGNDRGPAGIAGPLRFRVEVVDVDCDRLSERYGEHVPVLAHGERELCRHRLEPAALLLI